jgi:hypothetical protein
MPARMPTTKRLPGSKAYVAFTYYPMLIHYSIIIRSLWTIKLLNFILISPLASTYNNKINNKKKGGWGP